MKHRSMAENNKLESIEQLYEEGKKLFKLEADYLRLELVEKMTILISTLILILILLILGMVALFYLSFTLAYKLEQILGSLTWSYAIISGFILLLMLIVFMFRRKLIINPLTRFLSGLFLGGKNKQ